MTKPQSFKERYVNGEDLDVDDFVEAWHEGAGPGLSLDEFLGFTPAEGKAFGEKNTLPARKANR